LPTNNKNKHSLLQIRPISTPF